MQQHQHALPLTKEGVGDFDAVRTAGDRRHWAAAAGAVRLFLAGPCRLPEAAGQQQEGNEAAEGAASGVGEVERVVAHGGSLSAILVSRADLLASVIAQAQGLLLPPSVPVFRRKVSQMADIPADAEVSAGSAAGHPEPVHEKLSDVVIRFAGDSGDGMQLTGSQFTTTSAIFGNDLSTLPDFPAEIRAPAGTLPGVSAFQVRIADYDIHTPGDAPDVLVAMNPAALKTNLRDLKPNGILIVNKDEFGEVNLKKAAYAVNPLEDGSLDGYRLFEVDLTRLTRNALAHTTLGNKQKDLCKNFFALGMAYWLFSRPLDQTVDA